MGGGEGRKRQSVESRIWRTSAFSCIVFDLMTSVICFKIIQEVGSGCGWGWGRIGHG